MDTNNISTDILDSKIKKLRIELPHFSFSHSSSEEESQHTFVGRKQIRKKLKKLVEATDDKTGVYLVTGNRGVGKTSLVNKVISQTSLQPDSIFFKNLNYLFILISAVIGTQFCLQEFGISPIKFNNTFWIILILGVVCFFLLCCFNGFRHKISKQKHRICKYLKEICDSFIFGLNELFFLTNPYNPYKTTQYLLKIIFIVCFAQIISLYTDFTSTFVFIFYLGVVFVFMLGRFGRNKWRNYKKERLPRGGIIFKFLIQIIFYESLFPFWTYIKNYNRVYLRINFGHKLNDEKDILRLIARTLSTEYDKYHRSFWHVLPWRVMAFGFLLLFAYLFSAIVENQKFYKPIKNSELYKASSQIFLGDTNWNKGSTQKDILDVRTLDNNGYFHLYFNQAEINLLVLDRFIFEISKIVEKIPQFLFCKTKISFDNEIVTPINYLFWLTFFSMYLFCVLLFRCRWFTAWFSTHGIIKRQLKRLNRDITYSTELENSINIKSAIPYFEPTIGTRTKKSRGVADAREIEKELQDILNNVQRIPIFMCRPNFVIVFDELDKVEPGESELEKESQEAKASLFSIDATRERQTEILKILSSMKYFLSTAQAKFIFIAGREMYDIYLADVSDRNNYIGSIFNAVIHVPSFLTDHSDGTHADMTSLTEEFVCRRLIPYCYCPEKMRNLTTYQEYLDEYIYKGLSQKKKDIDEKIKEKALKEKERNYWKREKNIQLGEEREIQKIIAILQQFIIYLAHISKGAPKKMMQLFETFIEVYKIDEKEEERYLVVQRYHSSRFFLTFSYYRQFALGIIAYLITPIFNHLSESNIKEHSDKLLVSSLRFVDFLFKFHKYTFSWKNLDISPELLEVNHSPELKSVVIDLLNYLAEIHINKSSFSLNDYKFDSLIANEIFAMTATDEVFSALFSFSLDETLPLKKHYQKLLGETLKEYEYRKDKNSDEFINAISSLQIVLGDLHYYDDQLEEAGIYYKNAVQPLRNLKPKIDDKSKDNEEDEDYETMTLEQLYLYVRNMLKLGMIYEKKKEYDFAYLTYGELCKRIIRERDISIKELRAGVVLRKVKNEVEFCEASTIFETNKEDKVVFVKASGLGDKEAKKYYDNIEIPQLETNGVEVPDSIASPQPLSFQKISPNTNDMLFKKMTYEGLKLLYLPFIAKLQILEKSHIGGITSNHLEQLEKEFTFLTSVIAHKEAKLLEADFYSRVADILYYKNSDLKKCNKNDDKENNCSCSACHYYNKALYTLLDKDEKLTVIKLLSACVEKICDDSCNMKYYTVLARILSDWGNVFFSCDVFNKKIEKNKTCYICGGKECNTYQMDNINLEKYIKYVISESNNLLIDNKNISKKEISFAMYAISLKAYTKANLYKRSAYQIYKMLSLLDHYKIYNVDFNKLSQKAIRSLWYATENLNIFELNKRKKDFGKNTIDEEIPLQNLLVDSEINRIKILVKKLEIKQNKAPENLKNYYSLHITSPYSINYSISTRIYQLRLKTIVNYEVYDVFRRIAAKKFLSVIHEFQLEKYNEYAVDIKKRLTYFVLLFILEDEKVYDEANKILSNSFAFDTTEKQKTMFLILEKLIAETIFCLKEISRLVKTIGETYLFNHSFMGSVHDKLSYWIRGYEAYKILKKDIEEEKNKNLMNLFIKNTSKTNSLKNIIHDSKIDKYLEYYLGEEWEEQLSGYYENEAALSHYHKCLEMHSEGRAYHTMIDSMIYIKDDYNDRSDHFNIAEERYMILNGEIKEKIDKLEKHFRSSKLYDVNNYFENDLGNDKQ